MWAWLLLSACGLKEVPPDLTKTKRISGEHYTLVYPGNWTVQDKEPDYNKNTHVRIQSPGGTCNILIEVYSPAVPLRPKLQKIAKLKTLTLKDPDIKPIRQWGPNNGHGVLMTGPPESEDPKSYPMFTIFGAEYQKVTYTITEDCNSKRREMAQPAFDLIASTFDVL